MAEYVVVDKEQLEADLTTVADAIREKSGTTEDLDFPLGMKEVVESIDTSKEEQEKTISITENGTTEVTPDEGKVLSKVTVNVEVESEDTLRLRLLNQIEEYQIDDEIGVPQHLFNGCNNLKKFSAPNAISFNNNVFYGCINLHYVDFGKITVSDSAQINGLHHLKTLIYRSETLVTLKSAFTNNNSIKNGTCYFYVPRALIEEYKVATNWTTYANQFRALEDYTVDGTITGKFDESKI